MVMDSFCMLKSVINEEVEFFPLRPDEDQIEGDTSCQHLSLKKSNFAVYSKHSNDFLERVMTFLLFLNAGGSS